MTTQASYRRITTTGWVLVWAALIAIGELIERVGAAAS